jgi:hypothetical protein
MENISVLEAVPHGFVMPYSPPHGIFTSQERHFLLSRT